MRTRLLLISGLLLLPGLSSAQRFPMPVIGAGGRPGTAVPLPPRAPEVARQLAYKRLAYSAETYPMVSYMMAPAGAFPGASTGWATFGMGTRLDYRVAPFVSATLDITSSMVGGPANTQTVELGTRFRPERVEATLRRLYPFIDVRLGYMSAYATYGWPNNIYGESVLVNSSSGPSFSHGFGGVAGAGFEVALSRRFSLTSAASVMRTQMRAHGYNNVGPRDRSFSMTALRYTLGLRFNPVRAVRTPGAELPPL